MFRHLILVRHASAEERIFSREDFARALTDKGHWQAKALAKASREQNLPRPDWVFSSGYRRAEETLRAFFSEDDAVVCRDIGFSPEGDPRKSLQFVFDKFEKPEARIPAPEASRGGCAWIFGHNPHLEFLLEDFAPQVLQKIQIFRKASLVWLDWGCEGFQWNVHPELRLWIPKPKF
jgi:phosphohistidine phosphatase SixA